MSNIKASGIGSLFLGLFFTILGILILISGKVSAGAFICIFLGLISLLGGIWQIRKGIW